MNESKWVSRNLRPGAMPGKQGPLPTFGRQHSRRESSRPFKMRSRQARRSLNRRVGIRVFVSAIGAACLLLAVVLAFYARVHRLANPDAPWLSLRPPPVDAGPEPIIHDPGVVIAQFLDATSREELAGLVRHDQDQEAMLDRHTDDVLRWLEGHRDWQPVHEAQANGLIFTLFEVSHVSDDSRPVYVVQTPDGPRVDLAAFLAWCSEDWEDLAGGRVADARVVRALVSNSAYYNYDFDNDSVYRNYRLDPHGDGPSLWGYVLRGTATAAALDKLIAEGYRLRVVISLDRGERGIGHRQFRIRKVLAAGWAVGPEVLEEHLPRLSSDPGQVLPLAPRLSGLPTADAGRQN